MQPNKINTVQDLTRELIKPGSRLKAIMRPLQRRNKHGFKRFTT